MNSTRHVTPTGTRGFLHALLAARLDERALDWLDRASSEVAAGTGDDRFCALLSTASRSIRPRPLAPGAEEVAEAGERLAGWTPERWSTLETARVALVLARGDLARESGQHALEEAFRFADEGEACALYRSLAHLPDAGRFAWRAGEGCRSNMRTVFEATACDTPFPARWFDDDAWNQCVIKCVFVGAPLWRVHGLDERLSPELARMALDLADERRSAGRPVQRELWLCLGAHGGARGLAALEGELDPENPTADAASRTAAGYALARAGEHERLARAAERETDPEAAARLRAALEHPVDQRAFRVLDDQETT